MGSLGMGMIVIDGGLSLIASKAKVALHQKMEL